MGNYGKFERSPVMAKAAPSQLFSRAARAPYSLHLVAVAAYAAAGLAALRDVRRRCQRACLLSARRQAPLHHDDAHAGDSLRQRCHPDEACNSAGELPLYTRRFRRHQSPLRPRRISRSSLSQHTEFGHRSYPRRVHSPNPTGPFSPEAWSSFTELLSPLSKRKTVRHGAVALHRTQTLGGFSAAS